MPRQITYLDSPTAGTLLPKSLVVLPAGSIEQHCKGPLGLDALIAEAVAARACLKLEEEGVYCVILPTLYYGYSHEWLDSPGTLSVSPGTLISLLDDIFASLAAHGARRAAIVNGHGGNSGVLEAAARTAARRYNLVIGVVDYWRPAGASLGHCDDLEVQLARDLLGLTVECECRETIEAKRYRISMPRLPPMVAFKGSKPPPTASIIEGVARALREVYEAEESEPTI